MITHIESTVMFLRETLSLHTISLLSMLITNIQVFLENIMLQRTDYFGNLILWRDLVTKRNAIAKKYTTGRNSVDDYLQRMAVTQTHFSSISQNSTGFGKKHSATRKGFNRITQRTTTQHYYQMLM